MSILRPAHLSCSLFAQVVLMIATATPGLAQVIDGAHTPQAFSDRDALGVLFTVVRGSSHTGWDLATRQKYLMEIGLTRPQAIRLIRAADAWFRDIHPLDEELREIRRAAPGKVLDAAMRQRCDAIVAKKFSLLDQHLAALRLEFGLEGAVRLDQALLTVKRGMKSYVPGTPPERVPENARKHH